MIVLSLTNIVGQEENFGTDEVTAFVLATVLTFAKQSRNSRPVTGIGGQVRTTQWNSLSLGDSSESWACDEWFVSSQFSCL